MVQVVELHLRANRLLHEHSGRARASQSYDHEVVGGAVGDDRDD